MSEMPLHSLICMSGGILNFDIGESIVQLVNGENVGENLKKLGKLGASGIGNVFGDSAGKVINKGKKLASGIIDAGKKRINNNYETEGECNMGKESNTGFDAEKIGEMIGGAGAKLEEVGKGLINKLEKSGVKDKLESAGLKIGDKIDELELDKKLGDFVSKASEKAGEIGKGIKKSFGSGSDDKDGE